MTETERVLRRMFRSAYREPPAWMRPNYTLKFEFRPGPVGNIWQNIEVELNLYHRLRGLLCYEPELTRSWRRFSARHDGDDGADLAFAKWKGGDTAGQWSSHGADHCLDTEFSVTEWEHDSENFWLLNLGFRKPDAVFSCQGTPDVAPDPGVLAACLGRSYAQLWLWEGLRNLWDNDEWIWENGWKSKILNCNLTKDFVFTRDARLRGDGRHVFVDEHQQGYSPYTGAVFELWI